jgi:glucose/arabinose dehydrogenase
MSRGGCGDRFTAWLTSTALTVLAATLLWTPHATSQTVDEPEMLPTDEPAGWQPGGPEVRVETVADGFTAPVNLATPPGEPEKLHVVDQPGQIWIVESGSRHGEPFLDLSDRIIDLDPDYDERGLLGLAFHPDYEENGRFFVYYSAPLRNEAPEGWDNTSHLSEFAVDPEDPDRADPGSERIILEVDQPFGNHNAGQIRFGDDGHLYVPLGDGGNGGDIDPPDDDRGRPPDGHGQTVATLLGSILRIDVDGEAPYEVPEDNPLVDEEGQDEIFAYGLRNPYGLSVDLDTGDLYSFEAGQLLFEEVNLIEPGRNYGWNIKEGLACFDPDDFAEPLDDCPDEGPEGEPLIDPIVVYERSPERGSVVVPGIRYRGTRMPEFEGRLIFGDYSRIRFLPRGIVYMATEPGDGGTWPIEEARVVDGTEGTLDRFLLGIVQDGNGEAYALTTALGGPEQRTGEVLALHSVAEDTAGWPWWAWLLVTIAAVAVASVVALFAFGRLRKIRAEAAAGEAG